MFIFTLFLVLHLSHTATACNTPADCSYNGVCDPTSSYCTCDTAWIGKTCSTLHLLPAQYNNGLNTTTNSTATATTTTTTTTKTSSWGGTINKGKDGKWHMHAASFTHHCGINQWSSNSQIVHALSDTADGTYVVQDVVVPVWAHNPAVVQSPDDGGWVMTYVANHSVNNTTEAKCSLDGKRVLKNSTLVQNQPPLQNNYMITARNLNGPWSAPVQLDSIFDSVVPPFTNPKVVPYPDRNTNLILTLDAKGNMTGLWRRCCTPPPKYSPLGGGGASVVFQVHAVDWRNLTTWKASSTSLFPMLKANGFEDPHIYPDRKRSNVFHALFHNMVGGWHQPRYPNIQVGAHAYSDDGGYTWIRTGIAFNTTVKYDDGTFVDLIRRERPHVVLHPTTKQLLYLTSGVTYEITETEPSCTIVQPIAQ